MSKESKHVAKFRSEQLKSSETILATANGYIGEAMGSGSNKQHNGSFIITSERAAFYRKGILGDVFESMPINNISSIDRKSMIGFRTLTLHSSHNDISFKCTDKQADEALFKAIESVRDTPTLEPIQKLEETPVERLKKLGELKESGVISNEEFEVKKAELLALI